MIRPGDIAAEWDRNATKRCNQIAAGRDTSHDKVLLPTILRLAGDLDGMTVIDVGCGCGFLTHRISGGADRVLGIDISRQMIREATMRHKRSNLSFECISVEALARRGKTQHDLCVSNMAIMTMPNLRNSLRAIGSLLKPGGILIFSTTHPCFWNIYRKDESLERFDYWHSHAVRTPFRITFDQRPLPRQTTYFHRPLSEYLLSILQADFALENVVEPQPPRDVPRTYRKIFPFPRFLVVRARKWAH
jgi:2-polyprenyl-3-methyl-5-hydroxy-6-metoxy-1,4-benzoquinol methylase